MEAPVKTRRIFLLSPANLSGRRAAVLLRPAANFELAHRLRLTGAPLGEVFSFISGLYFRGKLAYANAFSDQAATSESSIFVITATQGLQLPATRVGHDELREMAQVPIKDCDLRYRLPLERDAERLAHQMERGDEVVLLGSIATSKYIQPLSAILGDRFRIPAAFIGRGDMSRGALLLRAVRDGMPLEYVPAAAASRCPSGGSSASSNGTLRIARA